MIEAAEGAPPRRDEPGEIARHSTGIAGLDLVLRGGVFRGGVYIVVGPPGAGKTILANQMCSHHVAQGGTAVYVTLLTESHGRMVAHLRSFTFFDPSAVSDRLFYVSAYGELERDGLRGLLDLLRRVIQDHRATLLVVDGVPTVAELAPSTAAFKRFLRELNAFVNLAQCTSVLVSSAETARPNAEHALADGVISLGVAAQGLRTVRRLVVHKFRGSDYLQGHHHFEITRDGLVVHPRTEALLAAPRRDSMDSPERVAFGVAGLDDMLGGGVRRGTCTTILGAPGTGKTLLGLHFLATGAAKGDAGLYFGFYETPERLVDKAENIGLPLGQHVAAGAIELQWQPALEHLLDALAERLLNGVRRTGAKRVCIDGLNAFEQASTSTGRLARFFTALTNELRGLGATTLLSVEAHVFHNRVEMPISGLAPTVENIVFLRYTELHSQSYRLLSLLKVRDYAYDPAIREFQIGPRGFHVAGNFSGAEAILRGTRRPGEGRDGAGDGDGDGADGDADGEGTTTTTTTRRSRRGRSAGR